MADIECGNDSRHSFTVNKTDLFDYDNDKLTTFCNTGKYKFIAPTLLTALCNKGVLNF